MLNFIDTFFYKRERASKMKNRSVRNAKDIAHKNDFGLGSGAVIRSLCTSKDQVGLDGWKDDKEKFKIDLLNDIKTFLFGRWEKPWRPGLIFDQNGKVISGFRNVIGKRVYKNQINVLTLESNKGESPFFITLKKLKELGGKITDKDKVANIISYVPIADKEKEANTEGKYQVKYMLPKLHNVINVDFTEGAPKPKFTLTEFKNLELNEYVENFIKELVRLKRIPKLIYDQSDKCYYVTNLTHTTDEIHLVEIRQFKEIESYYSTLFHEITHSTMFPSRVGRGNYNKGATEYKYANEELVAEIGAMIICSELGLRYNRQNSLTYLKGWLNRVKGDTDEAMIEAYSFACDSAEFLLKDINLEKLVPKSLQERAKSENSTEEKPQKTPFKPENPKFKKGDKIISNDGKSGVVRSCKYLEKDELTNQPEGWFYQIHKAGIMLHESKLSLYLKKETAKREKRPLFNPGDIVSIDKKRGVVAELEWVKTKNFGIEDEGFFYRLKKSTSWLKESALTLVEKAPENYSDGAFLQRTTPTELDYKRAYRAHLNTSFSPEKRAKSHQEDFAATLNAYAEEFEELALSEEQKDFAKGEFAQFKERYKKKYYDLLDAKSRCLSSMITGPANFPVKKAEKANQTEHKRSAELLDFLERASKSIASKLNALRPKEVIENEATQKALKKVVTDVATIIGISQGKLHYNKSAFVNSLKNYLNTLHRNRQYKHVNKAFEYIREAQNKHALTIFAPNNAVWQLENSQPKEEEEGATGSTTIYESKGCHVVNNYTIERVMILMGEKPSKDILAELNSHAWKWSPSNKAWQRKNTQQAIKEAVIFAEKHFKKEDLDKDDKIKEQPTVKSEYVQKTLFGFTSLNEPQKKVKTYRLNGDLGELLGEFDRTCYTIALRGDKGAGKSRLLYQIINAFASKNFSCGILSAEMDKNALISHRYRDEYINKKNLNKVDITSKSFTYDEINQICKLFDVVAIDSWTKMQGLTQVDLDRLQKENPQTIIVSIFQSTTGKVARGGNMVEYDCGTVIHVHEGGKAICEKNRYTPTDKIYNVFTQKLDIEEEVNG